MTVGIYGIFDAVTDECLYVGLSRYIEGRWKGHVKDLKGERHKQGDFVLWFKEHDKNVKSMNFRIHEECEPKDKTLNSLEFKWTKTLMPRFAGKIPSDNEKWAHSDKSRSNISKALIERNIKLGIYKETECECGENFLTRIKAPSKYCSETCKNLYKAPKKIKEITKCLSCDKQANPGGKYCSRKCYSQNDPKTFSKEELKRLYWGELLSVKEIAEARNVSIRFVYESMDKLLITRRNRGAVMGIYRK